MSHAYCNGLWQKAMEELSELTLLENPAPPMDDDGKLLKVKDEVITWDEAFRHFSSLYVRYVQVLRKLEEAYDLMVQPQKRRDIRAVLEAVMARLCQVKAELVRFGKNGRRTDFVNLEASLTEQELTPYDLELVLPRAFLEKNPNETTDEERQRALLNKCLGEFGLSGVVHEQSKAPVMPKFTREQAIKIIQKNERGRQGMNRAKLVKERHQDIKARARKNMEKDPTTAATTVQRLWRGFRDRKKVRSQIMEELSFIGMRTAAGEKKHDPISKANIIRTQRKTRQMENELKYVEALKDLHAQVLHTDGPAMRDEMWEERYKWWIDFKEKTGKYPENFDEFYKAKYGLADGTSGVEVKEEEEKKGAKKAPAKAPAKPSKKQEAETKKQELLISNSVLAGPTDLVGQMDEAVTKYRNVWSKLDESTNLQQQHDENMAKDKLRPIIREKIREEVDEQLLAYLANIRLQVEQLAADVASKDKGKKKKKGGKKEKKLKPAQPAGDAKEPAEKKGKKGKKKGKGKKEKSKKCCEGEKLCDGVSVEDMLLRLVKVSIVQGAPKARPLTDFIGSWNYNASAYEATDTPQPPSFAQIRQCLTEYAVLPLGSAFVKANSPLITSILLYGPAGSGKTMLSQSVAAAVGATWIDLSPKVIEELLTTKSDIAKIVHMVFTVAKAFAPSVIYIDEVDRVFQSSKKKTAEGVAKIRAALTSHKDKLTVADRVLIIGNSRQPYTDKVDRKALKDFFGLVGNGKFVYVPCPDYATRVKLWAHFIQKAGVQVDQLRDASKFSLPMLAHLSHGYSAGHIEQAVQLTLTERRVHRIQSNQTPLTSGEFITPLAKMNYVYKEEMADFEEFTEDVSGEKERRQLMNEAQKQAEEQAAKDAQDKKKKKPKK